MVKSRPYPLPVEEPAALPIMSASCQSWTMSAKKLLRPTFAEIVAEVPESPATGEQFSHSIPRPWITVDGQRWHLRGDASHEGKDLHKLLKRSEVLAFHEYMDKRTAIGPEEREQFWHRAISLMEASKHSGFVGYEYKSPDGGRCLVVYEFC